MADDLIGRLKAATERNARAPAQVTCPSALDHPSRPEHHVWNGHRCKWVVNGRSRHQGFACQCWCGTTWGERHDD